MEDAEKARDYETKVAALKRKVGQLVMDLDLVKKRVRISTPAEQIFWATSIRHLIAVHALRRDLVSDVLL